MSHCRNKNYLMNLYTMATGYRNAIRLSRDPQATVAVRENAEWFASDLRQMIKNDFGYDPDRIRV
jgi:hypothetical protein